MSGIVTISSGNEEDLQSAVANVGPVSTYVDASHSSFQVSILIGATPLMINFKLCRIIILVTAH